MKVKIIHVCSPQVATGSRILFEQSIAPGQVVPAKMFHLPFALVRSVIAENDVTYIFHSQRKVFSLLICLALSRLFRRKSRFVYDMHDLAEIRNDQTLFNRLFIRASWVAELIVAKFGLHVITVSDGLAKVFDCRYGGSAKVVYNMAANNQSGVVAKIRNKTPVALYFGLVSPLRLPLDMVRKFIEETGMRLDIYGRYAGAKTDHYFLELNSIINGGNGLINGEYAPDRLDFLYEYEYCFMPYPGGEVNIKYCMPNKLFQSLQHGLICLVSDNIDEAYEVFNATGYVLRLKDLKNQNSRNYIELNRLLKSFSDESVNNFLEVVGLKPIKNLNGVNVYSGKC